MRIPAPLRVARLAPSSPVTCRKCGGRGFAYSMRKVSRAFSRM